MELSNLIFVIAYVSEMSPYVFYEIGYAKGINQNVIIIAKKGVDLPVDIKDFPLIFYDRLNLKVTLEPPLANYIHSIKIKKQGMKFSSFPVFPNYQISGEIKQQGSSPIFAHILQPVSLQPGMKFKIIKKK